MAKKKVDVTTIPGYEEMTPEEKIAVLEGYEYEVPDGKEENKLKQMISDKNSEIAKMKKELKAKMTEDEQKELERAESEKALREELTSLRQEKAKAAHIAECITHGYSQALAEESAVGYIEGDFAKVLAVMNKHIEEQKANAKAEALKQQGLSKGKAPEGADVEKAAANKVRVAMGLPPIK